MPNDFLVGLQTGASVARMAQQRQERMIELRAQAALQQLQERQIAQEMDIKAQNFMRQQQDDQYIRAKFAAADEMHATLAPEIGSDAAKEFIDNALSYDPIAGPVLMKAREAESQMRMNQAHAKVYEEQAKEATTGFTPTIVGIENPLTGEKEAVLRTGPKQSQLVEAKTKPSEVEQAYNLFKKAEASGDKDLAMYHKAHLTKLTQSTGMTVKTNPDGSVEIVQGPVGGPDTLTKTNQSKAQEAQAKALETIDTAERLMPLLTTETVGLEAFAKYWIKDRVLAQRFPNLASKERAQASQLVAKLRSTAVADLKSDGNISDKERNEILASFPKANDPIDSPARAKMVVEQTQVTAAIHALLQAKRLNGEIPKAASIVLDDENVAEMVKRGTITSDLAQKIWKMKRQ